MNHSSSAPVVAHSMLGDLKGQLAERADRVLARLTSVRPEPLAPAIDAVRATMVTHRGQTLSFYKDTSVHGRPIVLLHGIHAAASAYDMKPLFERFRGSRPVFAVDLPGFGLSSRDDRPYTPELYTEELIDFLARVKDKGDAPDVIALSLSSELVARVAERRKDLVHTLTFLSPTGLSARAHKKTSGLLALGKGHGMASGLLGRLFFAALSSKASLGYTLRKSFVGHVDDGLCAYAYASSHQEGAEHAPLAFVRGELFSSDIEATYAALERPVLVLYDRDPHTGFDKLPAMVTSHAGWTEHRIAGTKGMPHFDKLGATAAAIEDFWAAQAHAHSHGHGQHHH
jgi:pimeloyl-ACP methyl ester carboxylesterase